MNSSNGTTFIKRQFFQGVMAMLLAVLCSGCGWFVIDDQREQFDMQVVQLGQKTMLVFPSDRIFYAKTANFRPHAYDMLDGALNYLNAHQVRRMTITGYTNNAGNDWLDEQVSRKQAEQVMRYLTLHMSQPIWINGEGKGSKQPIASTGSMEKQRRNRRITITFMDKTVF